MKTCQKRQKDLLALQRRNHKTLYGTWPAVNGFRTSKIPSQLFNCLDARYFSVWLKCSISALVTTLRRILPKPRYDAISTVTTCDFYLCHRYICPLQAEIASKPVSHGHRLRHECAKTESPPTSVKFDLENKFSLMINLTRQTNQ